MISTAHDLQELVTRARRTDSVALDTEFIWERTYYPQLGLIQLALSDEDCHIIDPLAISDLSPLGSLLTDPHVIKILHDAPQDLAILSRVTRTIPTNIFDTQVAAGFSGLPATISLAELTNILLEIDLAKTQTRTNWLSRPLERKQIEYALDDVRYLRAARILLLTRIIVPEIKQWLKTEQANLNAPQTYMGVDDFERFRRIKGAGSLDRKGLAMLQELAAWREQEARHIDRPRGHIIADKVMLAIVKHNIDSLSELERSGLLSDKKLKRYGRIIITCIKRGKAVPADERPERTKAVRLSTKQQQSYQRLSNFVQLKCDMQGIDPQLIASTAELKLLIKNLNNPGAPLPGRLTSGWRRVFLEEFFRQRL